MSPTYIYFHLNFDFYFYCCYYHCCYYSSYLGSQLTWGALFFLPAMLLLMLVSVAVCTWIWSSCCHRRQRWGETSLSFRPSEPCRWRAQRSARCKKIRRHKQHTSTHMYMILCLCTCIRTHTYVYIYNIYNYICTVCSMRVHTCVDAYNVCFLLE